MIDEKDFENEDEKEFESNYELMSSHPDLFDQALRMIRRGRDFMDVVNILDEQCDATGLNSMVLAAEARGYAKKLQKEAFTASKACIERGEPFGKVVDKAIAAGFAPFDAEVMVSRAQAAVEAELASKLAATFTAEEKK